MAGEGQINHRKRQFLLWASIVRGGIGAVAAVVPFAMSLWPSERAKAAGVAGP